jgi:hypothetical protein
VRRHCVHPSRPSPLHLTPNLKLQADIGVSAFNGGGGDQTMVDAAAEYRFDNTPFSVFGALDYNHSSALNVTRALVGGRLFFDPPGATLGEPRAERAWLSQLLATRAAEAFGPHQDSGMSRQRPTGRCPLPPSREGRAPFHGPPGALPGHPSNKYRRRLRVDAANVLRGPTSNRQFPCRRENRRQKKASPSVTVPCAVPVALVAMPSSGGPAEG